MIYTITFNPALDYVVELDELNIGQVNRTNTEQILVGGKGINVSMVLGNLGIDNIALGFVAGFTGAEIENRLNRIGCKTDFIHVSEGMSRINVKIKLGNETEINGTGPVIGERELGMLYEKLSALKDGDILVLAGSIPKTMSASVYGDIMRHLSDRGIRFIVDATGDLLLNVLKYKPFLVKPNNHELAAIYGVSIDTKDDIIQYARKLQRAGAANVLVSMAGDGAILIDEYGNVHQCAAPEGKVINAVGAGDSMVAGFIAGYGEKGDYGYALKMGVAAGSASAFSEYLATKDEIIEVCRRV